MSIPTPPPPSSPITGIDKLLAVACHLSVFFGFIFILPLVVFLVRRDDSPFVAVHAKESLNFHISLLIYSICLFPFIFIVIGIPLYAALGLMMFICAIIAAVKVAEDKYYFYPLTIRFIS